MWTHPLWTSFSLSWVGSALAAFVVFGRPPLSLSVPLALLASVLLLAGAVITVRRFAHQHPRWGLDAVYGQLLGLETHLMLRWIMLGIGLATFTGGLIEPNTHPVDRLMDLSPLCLIASSAPWILESLRRRPTRPMPLLWAFDLAEDLPGSLQSRQVRGVHVGENGRLIVAWAPNRFSPPALSLPVRGVRVQNGEWVTTLSRAVTHRSTGGKTSTTIHELPLVRIAVIRPPRHGYDIWRIPASAGSGRL
ncbi:hypothetical protein [Deinococcus sp. QL22]|uniref:hypothetical protein n=1 Tax=Deinococcus sp. QL22 TaxID=2939437 RepID=UPI002017341F|nr:hypothetical protein [Deinococcus sp. QL22]UQN08848.1 hypothetical protein M1R55_19835 [Deinococcus sp. QL22]